VIPITTTDFGSLEMNALVRRFGECRSQSIGVGSDVWGHTGGPSYSLIKAETWLAGILNAAHKNVSDPLGINKVDEKRADAEREQQQKAADAEREQQQKVAEKQARAEAEAAAAAGPLMKEIRQLSASGDLIETYDKIDSIRNRIQDLPSDIKSNLLDALQNAVLPIDKQRTVRLADLQHTLLEIQKLPDDEKKLSRLEDAATKVSAIRGHEAAILAEAIETMRDTARSEMSEAAKAPNAVIAEGEQLKATVEKERAKIRDAQDAAEVARRENEKMRENAAKVISQLHPMISVYSVAKVCADNSMIYDDAKVSVLKQQIRKYIEVNKISKEQTDQAWDGVQRYLATNEVRSSDCDQLGATIVSIFGAHIFDPTMEKSPF
jgi:chromosome segregation ATPase